MVLIFRTLVNHLKGGYTMNQIACARSASSIASRSINYICPLYAALPIIFAGATATSRSATTVRQFSSRVRPVNRLQSPAAPQTPLSSAVGIFRHYSSSRGHPFDSVVQTRPASLDATSDPPTLFDGTTRFRCSQGYHSLYRRSGGGAVDVTLQDGRTFEGVVVNADLQSDIALVKIKSKTPLPTAKLGFSSKPVETIKEACIIIFIQASFQDSHGGHSNTGWSCGLKVSKEKRCCFYDFMCELTREFLI
ncbi:unnamed protein product [Thlaspi arvense]|uniref:Uncharacterized protein n=1 Tax=Thlaspi arvense TaxID=13288 RepID=A0AAU9S092_THLAR|nr:unnamed protein product [Thlaspi arvense]